MSEKYIPGGEKENQIDLGKYDIDMIYLLEDYINNQNERSRTDLYYKNGLPKHEIVDAHDLGRKMRSDKTKQDLKFADFINEIGFLELDKSDVDNIRRQISEIIRKDQVSLKHREPKIRNGDSDGMFIGDEDFEGYIDEHGHIPGKKISVENTGLASQGRGFGPNQGYNSDYSQEDYRANDGFINKNDTKGSSLPNRRGDGKAVEIGKWQDVEGVADDGFVDLDPIILENDDQGESYYRNDSDIGRVNVKPHKSVDRMSAREKHKWAKLFRAGKRGDPSVEIGSFEDKFQIPGKRGSDSFYKDEVEYVKTVGSAMGKKNHEMTKTTTANVNLENSGTSQQGNNESPQDPKEVVLNPQERLRQEELVAELEKFSKFRTDSIEKIKTIYAGDTDAAFEKIYSLSESDVKEVDTYTKTMVVQRNMPRSNALENYWQKIKDNKSAEVITLFGMADNNTTQNNNVIDVLKGINDNKVSFRDNVLQEFQKHNKSTQVEQVA